MVFAISFMTITLNNVPVDEGDAVFIYDYYGYAKKKGTSTPIYGAVAKVFFTNGTLWKTDFTDSSGKYEFTFTQTDVDSNFILRVYKADVSPHWGPYFQQYTVTMGDRNLGTCYLWRTNNFVAWMIHQEYDSDGYPMPAVESDWNQLKTILQGEGFTVNYRKDLDTKNAFDYVMNEVDDSEGSNDVVFLSFYGHGTFDGSNSWVRTGRFYQVKDSYLNTKLNDLDSSRVMVFVHSCESGHFRTALAKSGRVVATPTDTDSDSLLYIYGTMQYAFLKDNGAGKPIDDDYGFPSVRYATTQDFISSGGGFYTGTASDYHWFALLPNTQWRYT